MLEIRSHGSVDAWGRKARFCPESGREERSRQRGIPDVTPVVRSTRQWARHI